MHFFLGIRVYYIRVNFVRVKSCMALMLCIKVYYSPKTVEPLSLQNDTICSLFESLYNKNEN